MAGRFCEISGRWAINCSVLMKSQVWMREPPNMARKKDTVSAIEIRVIQRLASASTCECLVFSMKGAI